MRLLITAGPTYEPIDAVRFLGNRSSGKLGSTLADHAAAAGWSVTLLLGPNAMQPTDSAVTVLKFDSTQSLQDLLDQHLTSADCLVMAAAVADFRPAADSIDRSIKHTRSDSGMTLQLEATPDLLERCSSNASSTQLLVGFALEPQDRLLESARAKLQRKNIDLIVANPLETMDGDSIHATLIGNQGRGIDMLESTDGIITKAEFADWLLEHITPIARARVSQAESAHHG